MSDRPEPEVRHVYDRTERSLLSDGAYAAARQVVPLLVERLRPASAVDVGCGTGGWLRVLDEHGVCALRGIDSAEVEDRDLLIPADRFHRADLRQPLASHERADLVLSIEVGEHLPPSRAGGFVRDLTNLGDVVVFSAAIPGAWRVAVGGRRHSGHINEQWPSYWAARFDDCGFDAFDLVRPYFWDDRSIPIAIRQHMMVYVRRGVDVGVSDDQRATMLDVVHPQWVEMFEHQVQNPGPRQLAGAPLAIARQIGGKVTRARQNRRHEPRTG